MSILFDITRRPDENESQYLWRLGQAKDSGIWDADWNAVADLMNQEFGDEDRPYSEAAYRKPYQMAKKFYEDGVFNQYKGDSYVQEMRLEKQELEKEKVKVRDERAELKRVIREEARKESYKDQVLRSIRESNTYPLDYDEAKQFEGALPSDNDLIISVTDIHAGIEIDNCLNKFNEEVLRDRFNTYLDKIFEVQLRHGSENAYVIISELISGLIHTELRIENNQDIITQFITVINLLSQFLAELSYKFHTVHVYVCPGNHSRISPKKEDSLKGENMDNLAIPFLEAKLQNFANIEFHRNDIEESIAMFNVRGNTIMASHGDKDEPGTVVQKFSMLFGVIPKIVYLGHRHTNAMVSVYNTKVIQSGCFSGPDNYCMDKRIGSHPAQTISVIDHDGLDCLYNVEFR